MICALHSAGEALCPFCAKFSLLLKQLQDSSVLDLADLNYVACGRMQGWVLMMHVLGCTEAQIHYMVSPFRQDRAASMALWSAA